MRKYIIFQTSPSELGWSDRKLAHTGFLTRILAEHYAPADRPSPKPGYRLREYHRVAEAANPAFPQETTHSRVGDWEVSRVEEYAPVNPGSDYDIIVICYCNWMPIESVLEPLASCQVTVDSFGGDEAQYREYLKRNAAGVEVG
jgi:hypothetical protein